jgi:FtsZ-interacting cell division protein YlmF
MGLFDRIMRGIDYGKTESNNGFESRPRPFAPKKFSGFNSKEYYESESRRASNFLMFAPNSFDDVEIIIDHLKNQEAVIINLKEIKTGIGQRVLDFISGAIYALDGSIQPIENGLFLLTPGGVGIMKKKD